MPDNGFEQFRRLVLADESLQKELRDLTDRDEFIARVVALGATKGLEFTATDVDEAMRENRRAWIEGR